MRQVVSKATCFPLKVMSWTLLIAGAIYCGKHSYAYNAKDEINLIANQCSNLSTQSITTALTAYQNAEAEGLDSKGVLTIVDFSKPSDQNRMCTVDLSNNKVLFYGLVAQGTHTGYRYAQQFSNQENSNESSLGLFQTENTYYGVRGYSLRIEGLDPGINDNAAKRNIVVHGLPTVSHEIATKDHRIGWTLGCFGVSDNQAENLINNIKGGTLIFAYYPDKQFLDQSAFLNPNGDSFESQKPSLDVSDDKMALAI